MEKNFDFYSYLYTPRGVSTLQFYKEDDNMVKFIQRDKITKRVCFLLAVVAPALLPQKLETEGSVTSYNPQRIIQQFGSDQGAIVVAGDMSLSGKNSEAKFINEGQDKFCLLLNNSFAQGEEDLVYACQEEHFTG